ncbi:hypothetical protein LINGRAHAP2_LOCUS34713 [Linum grandiflorum]
MFLLFMLHLLHLNVYSVFEIVCWTLIEADYAMLLSRHLCVREADCKMFWLKVI